jgi:hypothetical protein
MAQGKDVDHSPDDVRAAFVSDVAVGREVTRGVPGAGDSQGTSVGVQVAPGRVDQVDEYGYKSKSGGQALNIQTSLLEHPKFLLFKASLGDHGSEALEILVRLWGYCQTHKGENLGKASDEYLAAICKWTGDHKVLVSALFSDGCGKRGWLYRTKKGEVVVSGWEEHNAALVNAWKSGRFGGRPNVIHQDTASKPEGNQKVIHQDTASKPEGPPYLIGLDRINKKEGRKEAPAAEDGFFNCPPSLQEVLDHASRLVPEACPPDVAQDFFNYYQGGGWFIRPGVRMADFRPMLANWWNRRKRDDVLQKKVAAPIAGVALEISQRQRRAALEKLIQEHVANPQSLAFDSNCSKEHRQELLDFRRELEELVKKIGCVK